MPIKLISGFIANLEYKITLEEKNNKIILETEGITTSIPTANKNEFPLIPQMKEKIK